MPERTSGNANGQRLMTGDHVKLPAQKLAECIVASTRGYAHMGIMRPGSDKTSALRDASSPAPASGAPPGRLRGAVGAHRWNIGAVIATAMFHRCRW